MGDSEDVKLFTTSEDVKLFRAAAGRDDAANFDSLLQASASDISVKLKFRSSSGNTLLHVAAAKGNAKIVRLIADKIKSMSISISISSMVNCKGDTPLHLAARGGFPDVVKALLGMNQMDKGLLLKAQNEKRNSALHEALMRGHYSTTAEQLIEEDPEVSLCINNQGKSPLYLAVEAGIEQLVRKILKSLTAITIEDESPQPKSVLHAAIKRRIGRGLMDSILGKDSRLIGLKDDEGRMAVHYAASTGYLEGLECLIEKDASCVIGRDSAGCFPVHLAAMKGHVEVLDTLLRYCPDHGDMLDNNGNNILHYAAAGGKHNVVKHILVNPKLKDLINEENKDGNTPLHLAAKYCQPKIVSIMTWNKWVDLKIVNNAGFTALDEAESTMETSGSVAQQLTIIALLSAGACRTPKNEVSRKRNEIKGSGPPRMDGFKDRANTLLLVATLIATVTFAAGFTMPGGYDNLTGNAILLYKKHHNMFYVFVFCVTVSLYSSITVAVTLIWAQLGDANVAMTTMKLAVPLLGLALVTMSLAFMAGIFAVVAALKWLGIVVAIIGGSFLFALLVLFGPLCFPLSSTNRFFRYCTYYPLQLLIFLTVPKKNEGRDE